MVSGDSSQEEKNRGGQRIERSCGCLQLGGNSRLVGSAKQVGQTIRQLKQGTVYLFQRNLRRTSATSG